MIYASAFLVGLLGSLHCLGMCGPIAMAVPGKKIRFKLLYNIGRVITYSFLGAVLGMFGVGISLAGSQQMLSISMGIILIISALFAGRVLNLTLFFKPFTRVLGVLKSKMAAFLKHGTAGAAFMLGLLNGFLPCGLVYVAVAGAVAMGSVKEGALYMALFGLGTIPMMLAISLSWGYFKSQRFVNYKKLIPVFITIVGILFILRGMNLGIPYLSPEISSPGDMSSCMPHH